MIISILGNPGVTHSVPTAFINECSGYGMGFAWVTEDGLSDSQVLLEPNARSLPSRCDHEIMEMRPHFTLENYSTDAKVDLCSRFNLITNIIYVHFLSSNTLLF